MSTMDTVRAAILGTTDPAEAAKVIARSSTPQAARVEGGEVWGRFNLAYVLEASITLGSGESLEDFRRALSTAVREKFGEDCYAEEVYADSLIVYFYSGSYAGKCMQVGWSRNEQGAIDLGSEVLEVRRRTVYEPVR